MYHDFDFDYDCKVMGDKIAGVGWFRACLFYCNNSSICVCIWDSLKIAVSCFRT